MSCFIISSSHHPSLSHFPLLSRLAWLNSLNYLNSLAHISPTPSLVCRLAPHLNMTRSYSTPRIISKYDFRSDTVTEPTDEMFKIMKLASRGDDVFNEDNTTNELQEYMARISGKEAGLFVPSGTQSNQLAIRTHLHQPPHSVLCDWRAHIHAHEAGGIAFHSQASVTPVQPSNGHHLTLNDVCENIVEDCIHHAPTRLISLENSLNGTIFPLLEIEKISKFARKKNIKLHLDGARLFNVVAALDGPKLSKENIDNPDTTPLGKNLEKHLLKYCEPFDTVSLCLSKGIGAPIGSILVGPRQFIEKAIWFRKLFGGGIRQSGFIAAAARYALDTNWPILPRTHALAKYLSKRIIEMNLRLEQPTETNMVWIDMSSFECDSDHIINAAKEAGLAIFGGRFVIHHQITRESIDKLISVFEKVKKDVSNGKIPKIKVEKYSIGPYPNGNH